MRRSGARRAVRPRIVLLLTAGVLAGSDLAAKAAAERALAGGRSVDLGLLELRLGYNAGVAFGLGDRLPGAVVLTGTAVITVVLAMYAWRSAVASWPARVGFAAILAGALGNLLDRAADGVVTDYLHTGWWPTFNLADTWITVGAVLLLLDSLRPGAGRPAGPPDRPQQGRVDVGRR